jgi:hypothetical protein
MNYKKQYCSREQAEKLKALGVWNSCRNFEEDENGFHYHKPLVGTVYSSLLSGDEELIGIIAENIDAPDSLYRPIRLYSLSELIVMNSGLGVVEFIYPQYDNMEHVIGDLANDLLFRLNRGMTSVNVVNENLLNFLEII